MKKIICTVTLAITLSSCGIYKNYDTQKVDNIDQLFGDSVLNKSVSDYQSKTTSDSINTFGELDWHELFQDSKLQALIEKALCNNTDLQTALLRVDEAQATLKAAKLAFYPSFALAPQGGISSFGGTTTARTYSIPLTMSWEIDIFGRMRNAKKQSEALLEKSKDYQQAVRTQLIANVANIYYTLVILDEQLHITKATEEQWKETLSTVKALMKAGRYNEAGVSQIEGTLHSVHTSVVEIETQIAQTENSLSILLCESPQSHNRNNMDSLPILSQKLSIGIPLQLLSTRPDVRQAERNIETAYYAVNIARSAFYPSLTLSGNIGWTNSTGAAIVNPGKFLASALGAITAPLFSKGKNMAQLQIAKDQKEEAELAFQQTLLNAGKEVNDALTSYQSAKNKDESIKLQIEALQRTLNSTILLMKNSTNTYLEVITARQSLLAAKLQQAANKLTEMQSVINLYQALGGGQETVIKHTYP